jgi:lysophospholipid acyltransferase
VYDRLTPKGRKPQLSTLVITQLVSGLWHGIFPGYALFFISCAFFFNSSKVHTLDSVTCKQAPGC